MNSLRNALLLLICALAGAAASAAPATSQAIVQTEQGLALQTVDTPKPGAGQVLIKVYAAGVNPVDWKRRAQIPGFDAAGVIDSVGPGVTAFKPGIAVLAQASGSYAEYALANVDDTIPKPKRFTFEQAAGVPIAGIAGYRAIEEAKVQPGQRIVIIGAAGGTGEAAVQVAKTHGARIIAVGHSSQQAFLKSLGVDEFIAFDQEDVAAKVQNVDAAINLVDGQATAALSYVRRGGHLTSIAGSPGEERAAAAGVSLVVIAAGTYHGISNGDALRALGALAAKGRYKVTVSTALPLAEAAKAQALGRAGQAIGKTVLVVDAAKAKSH
jgi:NADPH:quinone reductase-like Zn-dependent oxidoreductase